MSNIFISYDSNNLVVNKPIMADTLDVERINVTDDIYLNSSVYTPVGSILSYAGTSAPTGWLLCNGQEVSRTTYARLYAIIGNTYGSPSSGSNFVLPNLADRVPVGKNGSTSLGNTGGSSTVTLTTGQLPSHTHTGTSDSAGSHTHTGTTDSNGSHTHTVNDPGHTHTQTTVNDDFNNSGSNPPGFSADSSGSRTWSNISTAFTGISINSNGAHTHTFTSNSSGTHTHTFTTDSTGSGSSVDIRNKYIVLNYIIRH